MSTKLQVSACAGVCTQALEDTDITARLHAHTHAHTPDQTRDDDHEAVGGVAAGRNEGVGDEKGRVHAEQQLQRDDPAHAHACLFCSCARALHCVWRKCIRSNIKTAGAPQQSASEGGKRRAYGREIREGGREGRMKRDE